MFIASLILIALILIIVISGIVIYLKSNKAPYEMKSKPYKFHVIFATTLTLIGLISLIACALLCVFDRNGSLQIALFVLGILSGAFSSNLFLVLACFVAIKGDEIAIRLYFKTKKAKISDIERIRRGPIDFTIIFKDGYKAPFFGIDPILDKIIERKDPETVVEDFVDPRYFWNDPKKLKRFRISAIAVFILGAITMAESFFFKPFDNPVYEEETVVVTGKLSSVSRINSKFYCFIVEGQDTEYQMPIEVAQYAIPEALGNLNKGEMITLRVENRNDQKPFHTVFAKADRICSITINSKEYLSYSAYREGMFQKRRFGIALFSFSFVGFLFAGISFSQNLFFESVIKSAKAKKEAK